MKTLYLIIFAALLFPLSSLAQAKKVTSHPVPAAAPQDTVYVFTLRNGNTIEGKKVGTTEHGIQIQAPGIGVITIQLDSVSSMRTYERSSGKKWFENPFAQRYFFSSTAIPINRGDVYIKSYELFFIDGSYGITNNESIGAGVDIYFTLLPLFYATFKSSYKVNKWLYLGGGAMGGFLSTLAFGADGIFPFGMGYGMATAGTRDRNITLTAGYAYIAPDVQGPVVSLNGMYRLGGKVSIMAENWFIPHKQEVDTYNPYSYVTVETTRNTITYTYAYGIRIMGRHFGVDLGVAGSPILFGDDIGGIGFIDFIGKL